VSIVGLRLYQVLPESADLLVAIMGQSNAVGAGDDEEKDPVLLPWRAAVGTDPSTFPEEWRAAVGTDPSTFPEDDSDPVPWSLVCRRTGNNHGCEFGFAAAADPTRPAIVKFACNGSGLGGGNAIWLPSAEDIYPLAVAWLLDVQVAVGRNAAAALVNTDDLELKDDDLHYVSASQDAIGSRAWTALEGLL